MQIKNPELEARGFYVTMVPGKGVEPLRLTAYAPQTYVSANSTIPARSISIVLENFLVVHPGQRKSLRDPASLDEGFQGFFQRLHPQLPARFDLRRDLIDLFTPDELTELVGKLEQELDGLAHSSERIEALTASAEQLLAQYHQLAAQLSGQRKLSGKKLQQLITAMIKELGMPQGEFLVDIGALDSETPKLNGKDKIEFLVSANPGLPAKPLAKVASGGELSRISLAIQVTTSSDKTTPTMIFDEVDSGIGGGIAEIVGQKLRSLSHNRQVMCVTHLPQVAAQAHHHLYVEKNNQTDITSSNVRLLETEERVEEIARMLGGVNITANTLAHAKEMLFQSTPSTCRETQL